VDNQDSIPDRGIEGIQFICHYITTGSGAHPASYPVDTSTLSPEVNGWGMKLTTHLCLVPSLRTYGAIPPFPHVSS